MTRQQDDCPETLVRVCEMPKAAHHDQEENEEVPSRDLCNKNLSGMAEIMFLYFMRPSSPAAPQPSQSFCCLCRSEWFS